MKTKLIATLTLAVATCLSLSPVAFAAENTTDVTNETVQEESAKHINPLKNLTDEQLQSINEQIKQQQEQFIKEHGGLIKHNDNLPKVDLAISSNDSSDSVTNLEITTIPSSLPVYKVEDNVSDISIKVGNETKLNLNDSNGLLIGGDQTVPDMPDKAEVTLDGKTITIDRKIDSDALRVALERSKDYKPETIEIDKETLNTLTERCNKINSTK